jgi:hypothetical protein
MSTWFFNVAKLSQPFDAASSCVAASNSMDCRRSVQAMRWMLKTKWSDFRLQAVSDG